MRYILAILTVVLSVYLYVGVEEASVAFNGEQTFRAIVLDSLPNLIACFLIPVAMATAFGTKNTALHALGFTVGFVLNDFLQFLMSDPHFAPFDIVFSFLGLLLFLILLHLYRVGRNLSARNRL